MFFLFNYFYYKALGTRKYADPSDMLITTAWVRVYMFVTLTNTRDSQGLREGIYFSFHLKGFNSDWLCSLFWACGEVAPCGGST